ncbi:signal recognition particle protein [Sodalis-like secondary symbiont of Drepanosiphum platanoidis]|uniref:signal recognition particle protein n=1 Tax=Sodalis-like secondary symbiont of Drepanosiphum platanoidis TaxID=2994493 RepID=UPI0034649B5C
MFEILSNQLIKSFKKIRDYGRLTEKNIKNTLHEIKIALLNADVSIFVIKHLIFCIKKKALGKKINKSFTPGQELIKIVFYELINLMEDCKNNLNLFHKIPSIILVVGLQGVGKTTFVNKLSKFIVKNKKKKVLVVSTDIYRPAAIKQLEILSKNTNIDFFISNNKQNPIDIIKKAIVFSKKNFYEVLIIDTAGRLHTNNSMMKELSNIYKISKPNETLLVVDGMTGQDAINSTKIFNKYIEITGITLTKMDGDARGGAALSMKYVTNKPIKFISYGEDYSSLEVFNAKKIAKRILDMNDTLSLINDIEKNININKIKLLKNKIKKGNNFSITEFLDQIKQIKNVGNIKKIFKRIPNFKNLYKNMNSSLIDDKMIIYAESIINSMTIEERNKPNIIKGSRKKRIAYGSGLKIQDVNKFLKNFEETKRVMKKIKKIGIIKIMRNIGGMIPFNFKKK